MNNKTITAYHFTGDRLRDGSSIPPIGEWLKHEGDVVPCLSGYHASANPFDALQFAPGSMLHIVKLRGDIQEHGNPVDKLVARERKIVRSIDAEPLLREFARWCALEVIHLWKAPDVVVKYLKTGDESLRAATWAATWTAHGAATWAAAWAAHDAATWAAAWAAHDAATWAAHGAAARADFTKKARRKFKQMVDREFKSQSK